MLKGFKPQYNNTGFIRGCVANLFFITYHNREDDGQEGGFEDPEHSQTYDLDQCEQVYPPQRNMTEVGEVGLVLGRHHVQLNSVPELWRETRQTEEKSKRSEWHRLITCRPI